MARRRYQRGALRKEGNHWVLRWREDVINDAGVVVRVERRTRVGPVAILETKALARRAADRIIAHVNQPEYRPGMMATVEEFAGIYEQEVAPTRKASAAREIKSVSRAYIVPTIGKYRLDEVTGRVPQLLITAMQQRGLHRKTIKNAISQLSSMLKAARAWVTSLRNSTGRRYIFQPKASEKNGAALPPANRNG